MRTRWARGLRWSVSLGALVLSGFAAAKGRGRASAGAAEVGGAEQGFVAAVEGPLRDAVAEAGSAHASLWVAELGAQAPTVAWDPDVPVRAGASARLLVAAAALRTWGPSATLDTTVEVSPTTRVVGGQVQGTLFLRTSGDPSLSVARLDDLAWRLRLAGVVAVAGDVVLDGTLHADPPTLPGLPAGMQVPWAPWDQTISPWLIEGGRYGVSALAGVAPGHPVQIVPSVPAGAWLRVENDAATLSRGGQSRLLWDRAEDELGVVLGVRGGLAVGERAWTTAWPVSDPSVFAAAVVAQALARQGIVVSGAVRMGESPPSDARVVVRAASPTLLTLLSMMQRERSDVIAESLLRTVGAKRRGEGTTQAGLEEVRTLLGDCLTATDVLDAGSSLSRVNRVAASSLACVMQQQLAEVATGREWASLLGHPERGDAWVDAVAASGWVLRGRGEEVDGVGSFVGVAQDTAGVRHVVVLLTESAR